MAQHDRIVLVDAGTGRAVTAPLSAQAVAPSASPGSKAVGGTQGADRAGPPGAPSGLHRDVKNGRMVS